MLFVKSLRCRAVTFTIAADPLPAQRTALVSLP